MMPRAVARRSLLVAALVLTLAAPASPLRAESAVASADAAVTQSFYVEGEGGVPLAVTVAGPPDAPAILFLHGIGMGAHSFKLQFESDLAKHFRLVAFDLRGHGMSGKPWAETAYTDPAVWALDVKKVIEATGIKRPVVVAWSYGTLVAADYIRANGPDAISGLIMIGAMAGLAAPPPPATPPDPAILAELIRSRQLRNNPGFAAQKEAIAIVAPMLAAAPPPGGWLDDAAVLGMQVPSYAQVALRKHPFANGDLVEKFRDVPVMLAYGDADGGMPDTATAALKAALPTVNIRRFENAGHSLFAEQPEKFNKLLCAFATTHGSKTDAN